TPCEICPQIDVILLAQHEANACSASGKQMIRSKKLIGAGSDCADATKANEAQLPSQNQPILQLGGKHMAIEIPTSGIASKFIVRAVDAITVEGRRTTCTAPIQVVGQHLLVVEAYVFVEGEFVRLKGIFAAEVIREEVACEVNHTAF